MFSAFRTLKGLGERRLRIERTLAVTRIADTVKNADAGIAARYSGKRILRRNARKRGSPRNESKTGLNLMSARQPSRCLYARSSHWNALSRSPSQAYAPAMVGHFLRPFGDGLVKRLLGFIDSTQ